MNEGTVYERRDKNDRDARERDEGSQSIVANNELSICPASSHSFGSLSKYKL